MPIAITEPGTIRAAIATAIRGLTPNKRGSVPFRQVEGNDPDNVGELRTFAISHTIAEIVDDGIFGAGGVEMRYEMTLTISYTALDDDEVADVASEDGRQIWTLLQPLPDGGIGEVAGLLSYGGEVLRHSVREPTDTGKRVLEFTIPIHYKASDRSDGN